MHWPHDMEPFNLLSSLLCILTVSTHRRLQGRVFWGNARLDVLSSAILSLLLKFASSSIEVGVTKIAASFEHHYFYILPDHISNPAAAHASKRFKAIGARTILNKKRRKLKLKNCNARGGGVTRRQSFLSLLVYERTPIIVL